MSSKVCPSAAEFRAACDEVRRAGQELALVPTMGALHEGHVALMHEAARHAAVIAVTIFVNPTQFGPNEDFERYPRDLAGDLEKCRSAGVELVFTPPVAEMYPAGARTRVHVAGLTNELCGASRPGHFDGVATVVAKLFAVTGPCTAVFGRKDYQQLKVIERMTRDLLLPVRIVGYKTVREADGLALSSRNVYLDADARARARAIPRALSAAVRRFAAGERDARALRTPVVEALTDAKLRIDYVALTDADSIELIVDGSRIGERALLAIAAFSGATRLIDNVVLGEENDPMATREAT